MTVDELIHKLTAFDGWTRVVLDDGRDIVHVDDDDEDGEVVVVLDVAL